MAKKYWAGRQALGGRVKIGKRDCTVVGIARTRLLASQLLGVSARDPVVFVAVIFLLAAVSAFASWLPARDAARVDPVVALRSE